jgi:hypothetical protein
VNANLLRMRQESLQKRQTSLPVPTVIFVCHMLSCRFVDSTSSPYLRGPSIWEEQETLPPERLNDLREPLT